MATGKEELGNATILGGRIDPLQVFAQQIQQQQRNQVAIEAKKRKDRDLVMDYADKFSPETKFAQLNQRLGNSVEAELRNPVRQVLESGDIRKADMIARKMQSHLDSRRREYDGWKATYDEASKIVEDNIKAGRFDPSARSVIRDTLFDNAGNLKPDNDIRAGIAQMESIVDHPNNLNPKWVAQNFVKTLPERITQHYTKVYNDLGQAYDVQENKTKLGLQMDANGNIILDEKTGQPKVSMTDDVYIQALQDQDINKLIQRDIPNATTEQKKQYVTNLLEGFDPKEVKNKPQLGFKTPEKYKRFSMSFGGGGYSVSEDDLKVRDTLLERAVSGEGKDIIAYFDKPGSNDRVSYATQDDKGNRGKFIKVEFANSETEVVDGVPKTVKKVIPQYIPINTGEQKRAAKIQLSARMDQIEKKTSVGEDYPRYVNEKRLAEEKKNPKKNIDLRADKRINQGSPLK